MPAMSDLPFTVLIKSAEATRLTLRILELHEVRIRPGAEGQSVRDLGIKEMQKLRKICPDYKEYVAHSILVEINNIAWNN